MAKIYQSRKEGFVQRHILMCNGKSPWIFDRYFKATENGLPILDTDAARKLYEDCLNRTDIYEAPVHAIRQEYQVRNAEGRCDCGHWMVITDQGNGFYTCPGCGEKYDIYGTPYVAPEYAEYETEDKAIC